MTHLDERIGRLLDALQEGGLREDTVVVYTSDHGEFIGEHGLWWKNDFYEHAVASRCWSPGRGAGSPPGPASRAPSPCWT